MSDIVSKCKHCHFYNKENDYCTAKDINNCSKQDIVNCIDYLVNFKLVNF